VEFLYYWLHRALHHHYLYSRYHSHHHSSIVTEPITGNTLYDFINYPIQYKNFIVLGKVENTPASNHDTWQK
jgi:hypothetical protein